MKYLAITLLILLSAQKCKEKKENKLQEKTLQVLIENYRDGEILSCDWNGQLVFKGSLNAHDAGSEIFNISGLQLGSCYYNSGAVDAMCEELKNCEAIYRIKKNIWGKPGVNTYDL